MTTTTDEVMMAVGHALALADAAKGSARPAVERLRDIFTEVEDVLNTGASRWVVWEYLNNKWLTFCDGEFFDALRQLRHDRGHALSGRRVYIQRLGIALRAGAIANPYGGVTAYAG